MGYPILGDKIYGGDERFFLEYYSKTLTSERAQMMCGHPRCALHAHKLCFVHPKTQRTITLISSIPRDMVEAFYVD